MERKTRLQIGLWLLSGAIIIYIQMILGGITRLTGSGLSITQWNVIMGVFPPLNQHDWQVAFDQYKLTPQFKLVNQDFTLSNFKHIFFWEYVHRLWARMVLGTVFIAGFLYFLLKKKLNRQLIKNLIIVVLLGGLEGLMGWIMVQSGLEDIPWVKPIDLTAHMLIALLIYFYLLWIALPYLIPETIPSKNKKAKGFSLALLILIVFQIAFGGLMAGTHAAMSYPTWPKFNGEWLPNSYDNSQSFLTNLTQDVGTIQLGHRTLAYLICLLIIYFFIRFRKSKSVLLEIMISFLPVVILLQITLGVLTLLYTNTKIPVTLGVTHQAVGWLTFTNMVIIYFLIVKKSKTTN